MKSYSKVFQYASGANVTVEKGGLLEATTKLDVNHGRTLDINAAAGSSPAGQLKAQELNANGTVNMHGSAEINTVNALSGSQVTFDGKSKISKAVANAGTLILGGSESAAVELGELSIVAGGQVQLKNGTVRTTSDQLFVKDPSKPGIEAMGSLRTGVSSTAES